MADIEAAKYGFAFSSGMAAMTSLLCILKTGDKLLSVDDVYGGVDRLMRRIAVPQWGLKYGQFSSLDELEQLINDAGVRMIWIESPTNPTLRIVDISGVVEAVKSRLPSCLVVVDNTFATPFLQCPLKMGADIVLHSVTKYIGGHSDVLMGAIATNNEVVADQLQFLQKSIGAVPSPFDCFMALRGLKTLAVRMQQHCGNAMKVAHFLDNHKHIAKVYYPGLASHAQHELAKRQMCRGFGGVISFTLNAANLETTVRFTKACKLITLAESLGGIESLIDVPSIMTHASIPPEARARLGITDTLLRLSVGIEEADDIIKDLDQAIRIAYDTSVQTV